MAPPQTKDETKYEIKDAPPKDETKEVAKAMVRLIDKSSYKPIDDEKKGDNVVEDIGWNLGNSKSKRILPFSVDHEEACSSSYECSAVAQAERWRMAADGSGGGGGKKSFAGKSMGSVFRPCDPVTVSPPIAMFSRTRKRFFFGVGINYMSQPRNRLTSCWNDIDALYREFGNRFGAFDQTWMITDRPKDLKDGLSPHLGSVKKAWSKMVSLCQAERDVDLFFVYSGHGTFRLTIDPGELGGQSDALVFLDHLFYDYDVMAQFVRPLPPHVHLLIVFDSCNSGSAANLPWTFNPLSGTVNQTSLHTDLTNDVMMISGCRDEQTSAAGETMQDLSECTRVLIETLRENPRPNSTPITTIIQNMRTKLIAAKDTQIPQLSISKPLLLSRLL